MFLTSCDTWYVSICRSKQPMCLEYEPAPGSRKLTKRIRDLDFWIITLREEKSARLRECGIKKCGIN